MNRCVLVIALAVVVLAGCGRSVADSASAGVVTQAHAPKGVLVEEKVLEAAATGGHCSIDTINGQRVSHDGTEFWLKAGSKFVAHGWLVNGQYEPPDQFRLVLVGDAASRGFIGNADELRTDVANALKSESAALSGFDVDVDLRQVPAGVYAVTLMFPVSENQLKCTTHVKLVIAAAQPVSVI